MAGRNANKEQLVSSRAASAAAEAQLREIKQQASTMSDSRAFTTAQSAKGKAARHASEQEAQRHQS